MRTKYGVDVNPLKNFYGNSRFFRCDISVVALRHNAMSHAEELRGQLTRQKASYRAQLFDGMDGRDAVLCLREIRRLEAELAQIDGTGTDKRE